jgi:hypothetical protein
MHPKTPPSLETGSKLGTRVQVGTVLQVKMDNAPVAYLP